MQEVIKNTAGSSQKEDLSPELRKAAVIETFNAAIAYELMWYWYEDSRITPERQENLPLYREVAQLFCNAGYKVKEISLNCESTEAAGDPFGGRHDEPSLFAARSAAQGPCTVFDISFAGNIAPDFEGSIHPGKPVAAAFARAMQEGLPLNHPLVNADTVTKFTSWLNERIEQEVLVASELKSSKANVFIPGATTREAFPGPGRFQYRNFWGVDFVSYNCAFSELMTALAAKGRELAFIHERFSLDRHLEVRWGSAACSVHSLI